MVRWLRWCRLRQWLRLHRRCRCGPIGFFCVLGTVSLMTSIICFSMAFRHQLFDILLKCQNKESMDIISDYCQAYRDGQITGSLCHPLCESKQVQFEKCTDMFHAGKGVSIMSCTDFCLSGKSVPAVLKYPNDNASVILSNHPLSFPADAEEKTVNFYQHTDEEIRKVLNWEFGFVPSQSGTNLTELMWEKEIARFTEGTAAQRMAFRSIMMVMDQEEYRAVKLLESSGVVPRIYGACGPLYLQESCPPGVLDEVGVLFTDPKHVPMPWGQKALIIIQLLQLVQRLEEDFPEVLHLCDVKPTNFGVCSDGSVRLIDADTVFFHSRMLETFRSDKCQTHDDCHFFDCGGWCQTDKGKCHAAITNNNLQTVCRDVLTSEVPRLLGGGSLFSGAPATVASKLQAAVNDCLSQSSTEGQGEIPVHKPPLSVLTTLIRLLEQSLLERDDGL